jgi:hypothetical protein
MQEQATHGAKKGQLWRSSTSPVLPAPPTWPSLSPAATCARSTLFLVRGEAEQHPPGPAIREVLKTRYGPLQGALDVPSTQSAEAMAGTGPAPGRR